MPRKAANATSASGRRDRQNAIRWRNMLCYPAKFSGFFEFFRWRMILSENRFPLFGIIRRLASGSGAIDEQAALGDDLLAERQAVEHLNHLSVGKSGCYFAGLDR